MIWLSFIDELLKRTESEFKLSMFLNSRLNPYNLLSTCLEVQEQRSLIINIKNVILIVLESRIMFLSFYKAL